MRIAILTRGDLFPTVHGAAVKIVRTAEALAMAGDHVVVVTEDRDAYWRLRREVGAIRWEAIRFGARFRAAEEWPIVRNQARVERWLRRIGYPEEEFFLYRPILDAAWWARTVYVGLRERIDVFQAEFPGYAAPAWGASRVLGGRAIAVEHNVEHDRLRQMAGLSEGAIGRIRGIEVALMRAMDGVIAVSEEDRARLQGDGVPRVSVVPHGVALATFGGSAVDLRERYDLGSGPILFFHGTLHYAPNTQAVRFIAEQLLPALDETVNVVCAGTSPPVEYASDRLRFTGPVDDLAGHIAGADICICPLFAGGGTRLKLMEYFAAGKPVISTPLGAEGLAVRHGEELLLVEADGFASAITALLGDAETRRSLGRVAKRYASGRDWRDVTEAYRRLHAGDPSDFVPRPSVESHLPPRIPSKPLTMLLLINRGCNLRCSFCDLWDGHVHLPRERVDALMDDAAAIGTKTVVLTGGEPLLHPGLIDIVRAARVRGMAVNITTNGTLVDRHYDALVEAGVASLSFSIDGEPETHDRIRGQVGAHARTWKALIRTIHGGKIDTAVYFVVTRENVRELVRTWRHVRAAGARFDFWPVNDAVDQYLTSDEEKAAWLDAVETIAASDDEVARKAHYYAEALRYHAGDIGKVRCLGLVDQYGVTYTGDLLPCCVWGGDGLKVGNVFSTPLRELWHSPAVQVHREQLWAGGCSAGCYNHSLYELTQSTGQSHRVGA